VVTQAASQGLSGDEIGCAMKWPDAPTCPDFEPHIKNSAAQAEYVRLVALVGRG